MLIVLESILAATGGCKWLGTFSGSYQAFSEHYQIIIYKHHSPVGSTLRAAIRDRDTRWPVAALRGEVCSRMLDKIHRSSVHTQYIELFCDPLEKKTESVLKLH